jgi:hypothetical protein
MSSVCVCAYVRKRGVRLCGSASTIFPALQYFRLPACSLQGDPNIQCLAPKQLKQSLLTLLDQVWRRGKFAYSGPFIHLPGPLCLHCHVMKVVMYTPSPNLMFWGSLHHLPFQSGRADTGSVLLAQGP